MTTTKNTLFATATAAAIVLTALFFTTATASADYSRGGDDTRVSNSNSATVINNVEVEAETGDNDAEGGEGDDGGNARSSSSYRGLWHWWGNYGGNATGGNGGNGGNGGTINTGAANADGLVNNVVNRNVTRVTR